MAFDLSVAISGSRHGHAEQHPAWPDRERADPGTDGTGTGRMRPLQRTSGH